MKKIMILLVLLVPLNPSQSMADEFITSATNLSQSVKFVPYIKSLAVMEQLDKNALDSDLKSGIICNETYKMHPSSISVEAPITFPDNSEYPTDGIWMHRYVLERCGQTHTYNLYMVARKDAPPKPIPMIMGNTSASILLIKDALVSVYTKLSPSIPKSCNFEQSKQSLFIKDSKVLERSKNSWKEEWLATMCSNDYKVKIEFTSDGKGGTYFKVQ